MWSRGMERPARRVTLSMAVTSSGFVLSSGSYLLKSGSINHGLMKTIKMTMGNAASQKSAHHRRGIRRISHRRIESNNIVASRKCDSSLAQSRDQEPQL